MNSKKLMEQERERIREEELVRLEARTDFKRRNTPRLLLLAALWTAIFASLAFIRSHLH